MSTTHTNLAGFIWSVADPLRGDYKQSEYGKVILPFTVLRRLDCALAPTKDAVLEHKQKLTEQNIQNMKRLTRTSKVDFYNTSKLDFRASVRDQALAPLGKLSSSVDKAVWNAVSVADPEGELQANKKGNPQPDGDLRDNENVPLDVTTTRSGVRA